MAFILMQLLEVCPAEFVDKPNQYGWAPLHIFANGKNQPETRAGMAQQLLQAKADPNVLRKKRYDAAARGSVHYQHPGGRGAAQERRGSRQDERRGDVGDGLRVEQHGDAERAEGRRGDAWQGDYWHWEARPVPKSAAWLGANALASYSLLVSLLPGEIIN